MSWIRASFRRSVKAGPPVGRWFRPALERLEDRLAPATFTVSNISDSGPGSLRQALLDSNAATGGTNLIQFSLLGNGLHTISPLSALPTITKPVVLNGYSQPGASVNTLTSGDNAVLAVELNGALAGRYVTGLTLAARGITIRGLVIDAFNVVQVSLDGTAASADTLAGNFIGTDPSGTAAPNNTAGGVVISAGATDNLLGGDTPADRNLISGNGGSKVDLTDSGTSGNVVAGNLIGTDITGTVSLAAAAAASGQEVSAGDGITIEFGAANNIIGGMTALPGSGPGNVISGNAGDGVSVILGGPGNVVAGNLIGTDVSGRAALANSVSGVLIYASAGGTTVAGNVISTNPFGGVGIYLSDPGNVVAGNFIGTDVTGTASLGNGGPGVVVVGGGGNTIGGLTPTPGTGAGNVIAGNAQSGVLLSGTTGNVVAGDLIGTAALGNGQTGVLLDSASDNTVGGTAAGAGNVITHNSGPGVQVVSGSGNQFSTNSIFANAGPGIDTSVGPAVPVLQAVSDNMVSGVLFGPAETLFRVEFFANTAFDPNGYGQGEIPLGFVTVTTDANGQASFHFACDPVAGKPFLTATATNLATNDTSGFSGPDLGPSIQVPPPQTVSEDTPLVLAGPTAIVVSDPVNNGVYPEEVTLTVAQGTLTLSGTTGLTFTAGGNRSSSMTFRGTLADVNSALDGLQYLPANASGADTLTVTVSDLVASQLGGPGTASRQVNLTVNFVNDAPTFTAASRPAIAENSGGQTVAGFVTSFSPGPGANEAGQTVRAYLVGNVSNPGLFAGLPAVAPNGTLTYTLAPGVSGTSTFSVQVQDSGGTVNGGSDTSAAQIFTITVTPAPPAPAPTPAVTPAPPPPPSTTQTAVFISLVRLTTRSSPVTPVTLAPSTGTVAGAVAGDSPATTASPSTTAPAATAAQVGGGSGAPANQESQQNASGVVTATSEAPAAVASDFGSPLDGDFQAEPRDGGARTAVVVTVSLVDAAQNRATTGSARTPGAAEAEEVFTAKASHVASALLDGDDSIRLMEVLLQGDTPPAPPVVQVLPRPGASSLTTTADTALPSPSPARPTRQPERTRLSRLPLLVGGLLAPAAFVLFRLWRQRRSRRRQEDVPSVLLPKTAARGDAPDIRKRSA